VWYSGLSQRYSLGNICAKVRNALKKPEKNGKVEMIEEHIARLDKLGFKW
jgi:hypothetical protein